MFFSFRKPGNPLRAHDECNGPMALRPRLKTGLPFRGIKVTTEASSTAKLRVSHCRGRPRGEYSAKLDREPGRVKPQPAQKKEMSTGGLPPGAFFLPSSENS